jgi:hypothetical protein
MNKKSYRDQHIEAWDNLHAACHILWNEIIKALRVRQILDWLTKALS